MSAIQAAAFPERFIIEIDGEAAGLVVRERRGFRFYASSSTADSINQHLFASPGSAEEACRELCLGRTVHYGRGRAGRERTVFHPISTPYVRTGDPTHE